MAFELSSLRYGSSKRNALEVIRTRPRVASEDLVVPGVETASPVYYGVDTFSPTLVDLYTADEKRIVWSSRAHRKMMTTLFRAWHGKQWKLYSLSFWSGLCSICGNSLLLAGCIAEITSHASSISTNEMHRKVDQPLFYGMVFYLLAYILNYFEVINSCHNLEVFKIALFLVIWSLILWGQIWLEEYFHGCEPMLQRRYFGIFPYRIDFWIQVLGLLASGFFILTRVVVSKFIDETDNYGVANVKRANVSLIVGYWLPYFIGSFILLLSACLAHVEVMHQWFSWRLPSLESWVTGKEIKTQLRSGWRVILLWKVRIWWGR